MPIYAYKCDSCGFAKDVLQKLSDAPLSQCPSCGATSFTKQLTAAGFQLKGSGWYATDFKDGGNKKAPESGDGKSGGEKAASGADSKAGESAGASTESKGDGKAETKKADVPLVRTQPKCDLSLVKTLPGPGR